MPRATNQKYKALALSRILLEETDEQHPISVQRMIALLAEEGIRAERKSVYDDLEGLQRVLGLTWRFGPGRGAAGLFGRGTSRPAR